MSYLDDLKELEAELSESGKLPYLLDSVRRSIARQEENNRTVAQLSDNNKEK